MPKDLAPGLRIALIVAIVGPAVVFALMMKGGAFRAESVSVVLILGAIVAIVSVAAMATLGSDKAKNIQLPNPLHPANKKPSEPPSV